MRATKKLTLIGQMHDQCKKVQFLLAYKSISGQQQQAEILESPIPCFS